MRVLALGILAALATVALAACAQEEGAVNKARVSPRDQVIQEQQRQLERDRVIQEQRTPQIPR